MAKPTTSVDRDPYYVGYEPTMPPSIARTVRLGVVAVLVLTVGLAVLMIAGQRPFAPSTFEFGTVRTFEGVVRLMPSPVLEVERPNAAGQPSRYHVVAEGKFGADDQLAAFEGQRVALRGTLIYRSGMTMIEIVPDGVVPQGGASSAAAAAVGEPLGRMTLVGEIVDSKCHLGVMKPGFGKPHRACAVRCISGGVPPMVVLRDAEGPARWMLLVGADGASVGKQVLSFVAEPVEITGQVTRYGDLWVLAADPATFKRLL